MRLLIFIISGLFILNSGFAQNRSAPAMSDRAAERLLDQGTWGPTPADIAHLQQVGITAWLNEQFQDAPSYLPDQPLLDPTTGKTNTNFAPLQLAFFQNAVNGADQLRQRVTFALSEIWVVSAVTLNAAYAYPPYYNAMLDHAFGNYRDLMKAVSLNPAMGRYLNMANNNKGNPAKGTAANENYARELMQLMTIGLVQLNPDGSPALGANGNPISTYSQAVVTDTARALTGWTYPAAPNTTSKANNPAYYIGQMLPVETNHDMASKVIVGGTYLPPNQTAEQDLDAVLNALIAQPAMAPFVSRQLIQHLVTSNPSPAYIQRVASVFANDGSDREPAGGDHRYLDRSGSPGGRQRHHHAGRLWPSARAGAVCGESAAGLQRHVDIGKQHLQPSQPVGTELVLPSLGFQLFLATLSVAEWDARARVSDLLDADGGFARQHPQRCDLWHAGQKYAA
jgi:uncharacterized protein (DUF1800 family)